MAGRVAASVFYLVGWAPALSPITLKAISLTFALRPHSVATFAYCYLSELNIRVRFARVCSPLFQRKLFQVLR